MRHDVQMVQKRLKIPPLFWRIEMTAFAGVMLSLVWMFVGPSMIVDHPTQIPVDLPKVSNAGELQDSWREDAMFIGITRDGKTYFNTTQIGTAELSHFIRDGLNRGSKPRLYFRVDARAKTGTFLEAFDEVRKTGIEYIAIVTERREAPMPH